MRIKVSGKYYAVFGVRFSLDKKREMWYNGIFACRSLWLRHETIHAVNSFTLKRIWFQCETRRAGFVLILFWTKKVSTLGGDAAKLIL